LLDTLVRHTKERANNALGMTQPIFQNNFDSVVQYQNNKIPKSAYLTNQPQVFYSGANHNQSLVKDSINTQYDDVYQ
jgi:hypothetical protein